MDQNFATLMMLLYLSIALHGPGTAIQAPTSNSELRKLVLSRNEYREELHIREKVAQGGLVDIGSQYRGLWKGSDVRFLYGILRTTYLYRLFSAYPDKLLRGDYRLSDETLVRPAIEQVPTKFPTNAYVLSAYYWYVRRMRESSMPPPEETGEFRNIRVNGKEQKVFVSFVHSDKPLEKRLSKLFETARKADPNNPMVLQIASIREKRDSSKSYEFMKSAYSRGGKDLFPEDALYSLYDLAQKLRRTEAAEKHRNDLLEHLRRNAKSVWTTYFYARHPNFPK